MKKCIKRICFTACLFACFHSTIFSQTIFYCDTPDPELTEEQLIEEKPNQLFCDLTGLEAHEYAELPPLTIYLNFHFIGDAAGNNFHCDPAGDPAFYAPSVIGPIVSKANTYFSDPSINIYGNAGKVQDARIRYEAYGDPNDPCDEYFFYNRGEPVRFPNGSNVVNVIFSDDVSVNDCSFHLGGSTNVGGNILRHRNLLANVVRGCNKGYWNFSRVLNHELGHILGLPHSFSCRNTCSDMDNTLECRSTDPSQDCDPKFGGPTNGGPCEWGVGNNFMGYNDPNTAMTPCQWETMMKRALEEPRNYMSFCAQEQPTLVIESGTTIIWDNRMRLLNRNVLVETGATLTVRCEVRMGAGKYFSVQRGAQLIIDNGKVTNLCRDQSWGGMFVEGNYYLEQPSPFAMQNSKEAGILIIKNNSLIEHARTAISTLRQGDHGNKLYWGGLVHAENSRFINNHRVAGFMKYGFPNKSKFINCELVEEEDYDTNTIGVTIWGCNGITFERNLFSGLDLSGIRGINFGATIINGNDFIDLDRAVVSLATTPFSSYLDLGYGGDEPNYFVDNNIHVYSESTDELDGLRVQNNEFFEAEYGMWISGDARYLVRENSFYNQKKGVVSIMSGRQHNYVNCNTFHRVCTGINAQGDNQQLQCRLNDFVESGVDIHVQSSGTNLGSIRRFQGASGKPANNCFAEGGIDILAPQASTERFSYFSPVAALGDSCYIPKNNLSDGGGNNYILYSIGGVPADCDDGSGVLGDPPYEKEQLILARTEVTQTYQAWQEAIENVEKEMAYDLSVEIKEKVLDGLLREQLKDGNYEEAAFLLAEENTYESKKKLVGLKIKQDDFVAAAEILQEISDEEHEDANLFVEVQEIYLNFLQSTIPFELSPAQETSLYSIAENKYPSGSYARSLITLIDEVTIEFPIEVPYQCRQDVQSDLRNKKDISNEHSKFKVWPNPADDHCLITYPIADGNELLKHSLQLFDINGRRLLNQVLDSQIQINTTDYKNGVYFINIINNEKIVFRDKLIVLH